MYELLYIGLILFFFGLLLLFGYFLSSKENANYIKLQARFPNSTLEGTVLKGEIKGMSFVSFKNSIGSGKNRCEWIEFAILHQLDLKYSLQLQQEHYLIKMGKMMNLQVTKDMEIGVPLFDKKYFIKCSNEAFAKRLLTPAIQQKLLQNPKLLFGELLIDNQKINYKLGHGIVNNKYYEHFIITLDIVEDIIDVLKTID